MVSEDEAHVYENEKEESDKMEENELAERVKTIWLIPEKSPQTKK